MQIELYESNNEVSGRIRYRMDHIFLLDISALKCYIDDI